MNKSVAQLQQMVHTVVMATKVKASDKPKDITQAQAAISRKVEKALIRLSTPRAA